MVTRKGESFPLAGPPNGFSQNPCGIPGRKNRKEEKFHLGIFAPV